MKKGLFALLFLATFSKAEIFDLEVKRVDDNLYKAQNGMVIKTKHCYVSTFREKSLLVYDKYAFDNKLIFLQQERFCRVDKVME